VVTVDATLDLCGDRVWLPYLLFLAHGEVVFWLWMSMWRAIELAILFPPPSLGLA